MTDTRDEPTAEELAQEQIARDNELAEEVAIASLQGLLAAGYDPNSAGQTAWMFCVNGFFDGRKQFYEMHQKLADMAARQAQG